MSDARLIAITAEEVEALKTLGWHMVPVENGAWTNLLSLIADRYSEGITEEEASALLGETRIGNDLVLAGAITRDRLAAEAKLRALSHSTEGGEDE
jgi:hypothetical protein